MTERIRAALRDLMEDVDQYSVNRDVWERAEAALGEPVAERPPAVTIGALLHPAYEPGDGSADGAQMVGMQWWHPVMGCDSLQIVVDNARAVLARYGNHPAIPDSSTCKQSLPVAPAPPAEGEVAELVALIRQISLAWEPEACLLGNMTAGQLTRAADLLERLALPACVVLESSPELIEAFQNAPPGRIEPLLEQCYPTPIPISERLPGPGDCDAKGRVWFLSLPFEYSRMTWSLEDRTYGCNTGFTHWLPATALPLPQGEVQP